MSQTALLKRFKYSNLNVQVKGFKKIYLIPGEQETVTFQLNSQDFTFINQKSCRLAEDGLFYVYVK